MPKELEFRGELLRLARQARHITQKQLADSAHVTQAFVSYLEDGARSIKHNQADVLARLLGFPVSFFTQPDPVLGPGLGEVYHRRKKSITAKDLEASYAWLNIRTFTARRLLQAVEWPAVKLSSLSLDIDISSEEEAATFLRAQWNVPQGPVTSVSALLDRAGVLVMPESFPTLEMDGVSLWVSDLPPILLLNRDLTQDRMRFTLMHEVGHLVLHLRSEPRSFTDEIENEAHRFAGAFLMPRSEIRPQLKNLNLEKLAQLKRHWRVSMAALIMRAKQLGTILPSEERALWKEISVRGWRKREPAQLDVSGERPGGLFEQVVKLYLSDMDYSFSDIGRLVNLEPEDVDKHLATYRQPLRIVS